MSTKTLVNVSLTFACIGIFCGGFAVGSAPANYGLAAVVLNVPWVALCVWNLFKVVRLCEADARLDARAEARGDS